MKKQETCGECGMLLNDPGEYHPQTFCRVYQAGLSPWQLIADALWARGMEDESAKILRRFTVRDMNHRARPAPPVFRRVRGRLVAEAR